MADELQNIENQFDYNSLDVENRERILKLEDEIDSILRESAYQLGKRLLIAKENLPHGEFGKWLNSKQWGWSERTARNMMNIAQNFKSASDADLFPGGVLNLLAAPSTPESAVEEALERAESGEKLTVKDTKELIAAKKRNSQFDYSVLDAETREFIKQKEVEIEERRKSIMAQIREDLTQIREMLGDELFKKYMKTGFIELIKNISKELGLPDDDLFFFTEFIPEEFREFMPEQTHAA